MPLRDDADRVLYYAPRTRSFTALWLLEELGLPFRIAEVDLQAGAQKTPEFLALNPMGKVPVVVEDGIPIAELGALAITLADRHSGAGLAVGIDAPQRPAYLRWMFFSSAIMEPAFGEKFFRWEVPASSVAWGSFADMHRALDGAVEPGPYLLGDRFTAADVLVGSTARFGLMFGAFEAGGPIDRYVQRLAARDAFQAAAAIEAQRAPPPQ